MSLDTVLDAVALRMAAITDIKGAYSVGSGGVGAKYMPDSVDDTPIAIVWPDGGDLMAGNGPEAFVHQLEARVWMNATNAGAAFAKVAPMVERCRVAFRSDVTLSGACTRCLMTGYGAVEVDTANGKPFYVLPIRFEVLEHTATNAYSV
jgi:hypothetical protein